MGGGGRPWIQAYHAVMLLIFGRSSLVSLTAWVGGFESDSRAFLNCSSNACFHSNDGMHNAQSFVEADLASLVSEHSMVVEADEDDAACRSDSCSA